MPFEKLKHICIYDPDNENNSSGKCFLDTLDGEDELQESQEEESVEEELTDQIFDIDEDN